MKKRIAALVIVVCMAVGAAVLFGPQQDSRVNIFTGNMDCFDPFWCQHEQGHMLDVGNAPLYFWLWKSAAPEFDQAIRDFQNSEERPLYGIYATNISAWHEYVFYPSDFGYWLRSAGIRAEIFADIIALSGGYIENMPPAFRPFFAQFEDEIPLLPFEG